MKRVKFHVVECPQCCAKLVCDDADGSPVQSCPYCKHDFNVIDAPLVPMPVSIDPRIVASVILMVGLVIASVVASLAYVFAYRYSCEGAAVFDRLTGKRYTDVLLREGSDFGKHQMTVFDNVNAEVSTKKVEISDRH